MHSTVSGETGYFLFGPSFRYPCRQFNRPRPRCCMPRGDAAIRPSFKSPYNVADTKRLWRRECDQLRSPRAGDGHILRFGTSLCEVILNCDIVRCVGRDRVEATEAVVRTRSRGEEHHVVCLGGLT
jgi:hypothetical protein